MSTLSRPHLMFPATGIIAAAAAPRIVFAQGQMAPAGPFKLDPLGYPANSLEPHVDARTMEIHHDRHHQAFITYLNNFAKDNPQIAAKPVPEVLADLNSVPEEIRTGVRNSMGGHANHTMFWQIMGPNGGKPEGDVLAAIDRDLGGMEKFQTDFNAAGNHGKGATVGIKSLEDAKIAFEKAKEYSRYIIVEKQLIGEDFRALVVNNRLIAVAERVPAHVVGDGKSSIQKLIDKTNEDHRRGYGHENVLTQIDIDNQTIRCIKKAGYELDSVLKKGERLLLKTTANISTGGTAIDRTDEVHPENVFLFERIAKIIGLDVAGVDVIAPNVSEPLSENGGGIIEVNAAPGFRMHLAPSEGIGRNVAEHVIDKRKLVILWTEEN